LDLGENTVTVPETVSLPLGFDVPEGWTPLDPAGAGAPGVAFVAVHPEAGFTPNITLGVRQRPDPATLAEGTDLVQTQVHLTVPGADGPVGRVVLELVFTAEPGAAQRLTPDFRKFVASVHIRRNHPAGKGEQL
jgi:hypothetical protein